jgi:hypothetical protein
MRVLISGSRTWTDYLRIRSDMGQMHRAYGRSLTIIHGDCPNSPDRVAAAAANSLEIKVIAEPAKWRLHDRLGNSPVQCYCNPSKITCGMAGRRRNQLMLNKHHPDLLIAYRAWGKSNGTDDMIRRAKGEDLPYRVIEPDSGPLRATG